MRGQPNSASSGARRYGRTIQVMLVCAACILLQPKWSVAQTRPPARAARPAPFGTVPFGSSRAEPVEARSVAQGRPVKPGRGAQGRRVDGRVRIGIDGALQATTTDFTATRSFVEFVEEGRITAEHTVNRGPTYGGGLTVRMWKGLALGAALSYYSKTGAAGIEAALPHPFRFGAQRLASGTAAGRTRQEIGGHIGIGWIFPARNRLEIGFSAGPSLFHVEQDLISEVAYLHAFPYDQAQLTGFTTRRVSDDALGFHVGSEVTWKFARKVGVAGIVRFARARVDTAGGESVRAKFDVGGVHVGGGIRLIF